VRLGFEFRLKIERTEDKGLGRTELNCLVFIREKIWLKKNLNQSERRGRKGAYLSKETGCKGQGPQVKAPPVSYRLIFLLTPPMKMEQCSETSAYKIHTPKNHPKERIQHSEHSESLK
jgi:hypothetical protein